MKFIAAVAVFLAFIALSGASDDQVCEPDSSKAEDCNRCRCASDGSGWVCTRMFCLPKKIPVNAPGFKCEPNKPFKDACNSCTCDDSGTLARCTAMACDPNERYKRQLSPTTDDVSTPIPRAHECEPGTHWKDDCNSCFCSPNGVAGCTLMRCIKQKDIMHLLDDQQSKH